MSRRVAAGAPAPRTVAKVRGKIAMDGQRYIVAMTAPERARCRYTLGVVLVAALSPAPRADTARKTLELTVAASHPATMPLVGVIKRHVVPEFSREMARLGYRLDWIEAYGTLFKWYDALEAVEIGLADLAWVGALWEPSKLPLQNITFQLPFITDDLHALVRAFNQIHDDVPAMREVWMAHNQIFLGASGVETYHVFTNFPLRTLDDLKGRKILAPGAAALWLKGTGAIAVDGALSSYYTQLSTGVADGTLSIVTGIYPFRIHEVVPYLTLVGIGAQIAGGLTVNRDTWERLPPQAHQVLKGLGREYSELAAAESLERYDRMLVAMQREGVTISTLAPAEKQRWIDGLPALGAQFVARNEAKGLPAAEVLRRLMAAIRATGAETMRDWDHGAAAARR